MSTGTTPAPAPPAFVTVPHVPDLTGVPPNIVRELEFLRAFCYNLLSRITAPVALASATSIKADSTLEVVVISRLITASTTIPDPKEKVKVGQEVEYQLTMSAGGFVTRWASAFKGVTALTVGRTAGRMSMVRFRRVNATKLVLLFAVGDVDLT